MEHLYQLLTNTMSKNRFLDYKHPPYTLELELLAAIEAMDFELAKEFLSKINELERASLSNRPLNSLRYSLVASCTLFTRAIIKAGVDPETAFILSDYYINEIDLGKAKGDIEKLEYSMLKDFIQLLKRHQSTTCHPTIYKTIAYIRANIECKLSMKEIAAYVNIHPNYLANLFKKEMGETLFEYVDRLRIESMKEYLIYSSGKIQDMSEVFNFESSSYATKYFKKHTGYTPTEYRKLHQVNSQIKKG